MREIKFRAWDKLKKEWYHLVSLEDLPEEVKTQEPWIADFSPADDGKLVLMQYTGLKDKNGKEIYEGDILRYQKGEKNQIKGHVVFDKGAYRLKHLSHVKTECTDLWNVCDAMTVDANLYENPELLKD